MDDRGETYFEIYGNGSWEEVSMAPARVVQHASSSYELGASNFLGAPSLL